MLPIRIFTEKIMGQTGSLGRRSDTADPLLSPFSQISALPLSNKHPFSAEESYQAAPLFKNFIWTDAGLFLHVLEGRICF